MKRSTLVLIAVLVLSMVFAVPVFAEQTHIYGVVFVDANMNGVWDVGEMGMPNATVEFESAGGETTIELMSAPVSDELNPNDPNVCDYLNPDAPTPCPGTFGLIPAGDTAYWWKVSVKVPAGYYATTAAEQWVQPQPIGSEEVVFFGIAPTGAGGGDVLMPATGAAYELYAAGLLLVAGAGLTLKSRRRS